MKIVKIFPSHNHPNRRKIIINTSAGLVAGVLSFGCVDANAERVVNTSGQSGIFTSGTYSEETIKMSAANTAGIKIGDGGTITLNRGSILNNTLSAANSKDQFGIHVSADSHVVLSESTVTLDPKTSAGVAITANDMTGMYVESGGTLTLKNSALTVGGAKGNNNRGIVVSGNNSQVSLDNSSVQTSSPGAIGISATKGGRIDLSGDTRIETTGARHTTNGGSHGIYVSGADSALNSDNAIINTTGASAYGIKAENGGAIDLNETLVSTSGNYGHGLLLDGTLTQGDISGGSIVTSGKGAVGIWARNGATVSLQDETTINTSGAALSTSSPLDGEKSLSLSHGLLASDNATSVRGENLHITTSAVSASAVRAENNAQVVLQDSQIDSSGGAASTAATAALHALSGAAITGENLTIKVSGNYQGAGRAEGAGSSISLENSQLTVSGAGSAAALSTAARAIAGAKLTINHSTITALGMQSHGVSVEDAGSHAQLKDVEIETYGARSSGVNIISGATANILSSKITTTAAPDNAVGPWGPGILLQGANSSLQLTGSTVNTTQKSSLGISATNGSHLQVDTSDITTSGNYGTAISVANSTASITNSHINTSGNDNAMGIVADAGASVNVTGGSVTTTGNGSPVRSNLTFPHALASRNEGSLLTVEGTTLVTQGTQAYGATADDGGNIILKNLSVKTQGDDSIGLYAGIGSAKPASVSLTATNVSVETFGSNATGAFVGRNYKTDTAEMALDSVTLKTHGDNARGIWAESGAELVAGNTVIETDGTQSHGIVASNGGKVLANNVVVAAHGDDAAALAVQGTSAFAGQASLNNTILSSAQGHGIETTGYADIEIQNSRVTGKNQWLQVQNEPAQLPGNAKVDVSASLVSGAALTEENAYSDISLNNTSLWFLTGNSVLSQLSNNQSLINFSQPENNQYKTLRVNNYHGDNATIALNTYLDTDNSPTDQLIIDGGHADGSTSLKITNTGGMGALTQGNGIKVVDAISGATTQTDAFNLLNKVKAGPYEYSLYRSSLDNSNHEAWYLRSHKDVPPEPAPEQEPKPGEQPVNEPNTPDGKTGTDTPPAPQQFMAEPVYRAETSLYQEIPQLALLYNRMLIDSLHERTGEQFSSPEKITHATERPSMSWGRAIIKNGKSDLDGPQSRFALNAIQLGMDLDRESKDDGSSTFAGVLGNIGKINSDVTHTDGKYAGRNAMKSWGVGGYWTHFTPSGSYLDAVAQYNRLYVESSPVDLRPMNTKGYGLSASLETGYPWQPDTDVQRFIEPQAQVVYSKVKLDNTHDEASEVRFSNADSLTGRVSLRFHQTWNHDDSMKKKEERTRTTAWIRPGIVHEFRGKSKTEFSAQEGYIPFVTNSAGTWGQLHAGIDHQFNKSVSLTGTLSIDKSLDDNSLNYGGIIGIKMKF